MDVSKSCTSFKGKAEAWDRPQTFASCLIAWDGFGLFELMHGSRGASLSATYCPGLAFRIFSRTLFLPIIWSIRLWALVGCALLR